MFYNVGRKRSSRAYKITEKDRYERKETTFQKVIASGKWSGKLNDAGKNWRKQRGLLKMFKDIEEQKNAKHKSK